MLLTYANDFQANVYHHALLNVKKLNTVLAAQALKIKSVGQCHNPLAVLGIYNAGYPQIVGEYAQQHVAVC